LTGTAIGQFRQFLRYLTVALFKSYPLANVTVCPALLPSAVGAMVTGHGIVAAPE